MHLHPLDIDMNVRSASETSQCSTDDDPMGRGARGTEVLLQGFNWECHAQRNPSWYVDEATDETEIM